MAQLPSLNKQTIQHTTYPLNIYNNSNNGNFNNNNGNNET